MAGTVSRGYRAKEILCKREPMPVLGMVLFPTLQPGATFPPGHDSLAAGFPITSTKVSLSPTLKRHLLGRGAQTTCTLFLSKIEKKQQQPSTFFCQAISVYIRTFARVSAVKNNPMPLKKINPSLKALSVDLP